MVLLVLCVACDEVTFVERIVVVNETDYPASVEVRGDGGWLRLSSAPPNESRTVQRVIDQGSAWTFRFTYGDNDPVDLDISRSELVDARWRVEVPAEFEDELRAQGVVPPP